MNVSSRSRTVIYGISIGLLSIVIITAIFYFLSSSKESIPDTGGISTTTQETIDYFDDVDLSKSDGNERFPKKFPTYLSIKPEDIIKSQTISYNPQLAYHAEVTVRVNQSYRPFIESMIENLKKENFTLDTEMTVSTRPPFTLVATKGKQTIMVSLSDDLGDITEAVITVTESKL